MLRVTDLIKTYPLTKGVVFRRRVGEVRAVDGVSFTLEQGRTLGIVGESGSGKSTTLQPDSGTTKPQAGSIEILGADVAALDSAARRNLRTELQVVFQDPVASLDPRLPVSTSSLNRWPPTASTSAGATSGSPSCWRSSGWTAPTPAAIPPSSPVGRSSGSV